MPRQRMTKPNPWPPRNLGHGGGTWVWDPARSQGLGIKFFLGSRRVSVWGKSIPECIAKRDARRAEEAEAAKVRARLANGQGTVRQMMESWFAYHAGGKAPYTRELYERSMARVFAHGLGDRIAREVTRGDCKNLLLYAVDELDLGHSSVHQLRTHLHMAFVHGEDSGFVSSNPANRLPLPGHARRSEKPVWLDQEAFGTMRQHLLANRSTGNVAVLTALLTGLRSGELMGLCWDAVDLDAGTLEVRRAMQRSNGGRVLTLVDILKTKSSRRVVQLRPDLTAALLWLRSEQRRQRMALSSWRGGDHVFTREDGRPFGVGTLDWHNCKACRAIGIEEVSPHKLRHTNLSVLLARGVPRAKVAAHAGHINTRMLLTYEHDVDAAMATDVLG